jgi:hypothetical protein
MERREKMYEEKLSMELKKFQRRDKKEKKKEKRKKRKRMIKGDTWRQHVSLRVYKLPTSTRNYELKENTTSHAYRLGRQLLAKRRQLALEVRNLVVLLRVFAKQLLLALEGTVQACAVRLDWEVEVIC